MPPSTTARQQAIGIFDSGIGGLTVANAVSHLLPHEAILYLGDTDRIPYGVRSVEEIQQFSVQISAYLIAQGCKAIVVACNTATAAALPLLRQTWPEVPFIGMEPAVKPAAEATQTGKVGVLATRRTFESQRYASLMARYAQHVRTFKDPCIGLVELIEAGEYDSPSTRRLLQQILDPMLAAGADTFVLGCTHYPFVRPLITEIVGPSAIIIDPAPAIARQLQRVLTEQDLLATARQLPDRFWCTGDPAPVQRAIAHLLQREVTVERVSVF